LNRKDAKVAKIINVYDDCGYPQGRNKDLLCVLGVLSEAGG